MYYFDIFLPVAISNSPPNQFLWGDVKVLNVWAIPERRVGLAALILNNIEPGFG